MSGPKKKVWNWIFFVPLFKLPYFSANSRTSRYKIMNDGFLTHRAGRNEIFAAWKGRRVENFNQWLLEGLISAPLLCQRWGPNNQENQGVAAFNALLPSGMIDAMRPSGLDGRKKRGGLWAAYRDIWQKVGSRWVFGRPLQLVFTSLSLTMTSPPYRRRSRVQETAR